MILGGFQVTSTVVELMTETPKSLGGPGAMDKIQGLVLV